MKKSIPVFLGDVQIGMYTEEDTLGIDPQTAIAALRKILFEKTPKAIMDTNTASVSIVDDIIGDDPNVAVKSIRIATTIDVEVQAHYSE